MDGLLSDRFGLPLLASGQAQKEITHNEALAQLELLVQPVVEAVLSAPPANPLPGQCWIVGDAPAGDWTGQEGSIAGWTGGGWRFAAPRSGLTARQAAGGSDLSWDGAGWVAAQTRTSAVVIEGSQVVGARRIAIGAPDGGGVVDVQARAAVTAIIAAMVAHGLIAPAGP